LSVSFIFVKYISRITVHDSMPQVIIEYILFTRITQLIGCVWVIRQSLIFFRKHWELLLNRDMQFTVPQCECLQNDCHVLTRYTRMNIERQGFYKIYIPPPINWQPRYNWNIVESGVKHHKPQQKKPQPFLCFHTVQYTYHESDNII
jgi:hypothetical protein